MKSGRAGVLGVVLMAGLALVMAGCGGGDEEPQAQRQSTTSPPTTGVQETTSAARWETVATLSGSGAQVHDLVILDDAIQWRVRWNCEAGTLSMETAPPPRRGGPLVDDPCPGQGEDYSIVTGPVQLRIGASGPWKAIVDQQVDTPLAEPVPEGAASAPVIANGPFYNVEKQGKGTARLYRLADGRRILRFEDFEVSQNTDLFVWLSEAPDPHTSADATAAPKVDIGNLKSTVGNQNYEIPPGVPDEAIRSVIIWCEPVAVAYSAAALSRG